MNFTVLSPNDSPTQVSVSDMKNKNFGGNRIHGSSFKDEDYLKRSGAAPNVKRNPVDEAVRDIDNLDDPQSRKRMHSRLRDLSDVQKGNEANFITASCADNRPKLDVSDDSVVIPSNLPNNSHRKNNRWHLGTNSVYESELS